MNNEGIKYELNIKDRHNELNPIIEKSFKRLKKKIGKKIFSICEVWGDKDKTYFLAKKIYNDICSYETDESLSFIGLDLKNELRKSGIHVISSIIEKEYKHILNIEYENNQLKKEVQFYKDLYNSTILSKKEI